MFNEYNFEDLYGLEFGKQDNMVIRPDPDNNEFLMNFTTPNHTEDSVSLGIGMEAFIFFRNIIRMEIWDGDELLYKSNRRFHFFVNATGKDPYADKDSGHPLLPYKARETWLKPNRTYTLKVYRTVGPSPKNPIGIHYVATDGNEKDIATQGVPMTFNGVAGHFVPELDD